MTYVLGISAFYHDSAAVLIKDGVVVAAAQEERFSRKKHDESFPKLAIEYCLKEANISRDKIDYAVFYDKPILKFERILSTYFKVWPRGFRSFIKAMPVWLKKKLWISNEIRDFLGGDKSIYYTHHHLSHAASAYYASPFKEATIVTVDGVGEFDTTTIGRGDGQSLYLDKTITFPHSLGLLYSAFTYYLGFKVNSAEYKVMGLAPYGKPIFMDKIYKLIDVKDDGSFELDMSYFAYEHGLTMTSAKLHKLFGAKPRKPETELTQREMDIAASLQKVLEEVMLKIVDFAYNLNPSENLCLAGGVALNCVSNGRILKESKFKNIYIQPASGDAGGALGAAYYLYHHVLGKPKDKGMETVYLGPEFSDKEILGFLDQEKVKYHKMAGEELYTGIAKLIDEGEIIGWFQGKMEFGPRALGNRSILADPRKKENWQRVNLKIKFRESFRPFAPTVLEEDVSECFDLDVPSPYMLLVAGVKKKDLPAITHVDNSARVQTVNMKQNCEFYSLINSFKKLTGCSVLINTSFNVRGEPIVCTPEDAYRCFMRTGMDVLVMGDCVLFKKEMPEWSESAKEWQDEFELD